MDEGSEVVEGREVGEIFDYFSKVGVAALNLTGSLKVGDKIRIKGTTTDFEQTVDSLQIHNDAIEEANAGDEVGIKVKEKVRRHDKVYVL